MKIFTPAQLDTFVGVGIDTTGHVVSVSVDQTVRRWCVSVADSRTSSVLHTCRNCMDPIVKTCHCVYKCRVLQRALHGN